MSDGWFETVAEAQRRARRRLPSSVYGALVGLGEGVTVTDNMRAFSELGFAPHVAGLSAQRDLSTTVLGQPMSLPGDHLADRGAGREPRRRGRRRSRGRGRAGLRWGSARSPASPSRRWSRPTRRPSSRSTGSGPASEWRRAWSGPGRPGRSGLIVTLDWTFSNGRDWGSPAIPDRLDLQDDAQAAPRRSAGTRVAACVCARRRACRTSRCRTWPAGASGADVLRCVRGVDAAATTEWVGHGWLREQWGGPFMVKGVIRIDDASAAVEVGATRSQCPTTAATTSTARPASIRALPAIADAVGSEIEVCSTAGFAAAATSSRRWRWAPAL